jgi:2-polyprenyl-3-methyl-5-hydroxy-6-metoxy-1,4-benzoquinol methylase
VLYRKYITSFKRGDFETGFSGRIPDYGIKFWLNNLEKALGDSRKQTFLDIGAGQGRLSVLLAKSGFMHGFALEVDVDKTKWQKILQKNENLELLEGFLQENIHKIPQDNPVDFVMLAEVFEHIPPKDVEPFIDALSQILCVGGKIFLTTPNFVVQGPAEKSKCWHQIQPYGHQKHYSLKELINIFEQKNFKVEWYNFESGKLKRRIYNRLFYPICRLDQKFLTSKKIPVVAQKIYKYMSWPFIFSARSFFYLLAQIINRVEARTNSENNGETIILVLRKD